jgi:cytochrome P450
MELAKDPATFQAAREEVMTAYVTDPVTGERIIDAQVLVSLPLLQSIYVEALRLHVSINITREIKESITLEGYKLEKGSLLQAPSEIAQYDEAVWSTEKYPATEFWAARHIKHIDATDEAGNVTRVPHFTMTGRSNDFFPFGESFRPSTFAAGQFSSRNMR